MSPAGPAPASAAVIAGLFAGTALTYLALGQEALHGVDVHGFVASLDQGATAHHHHLLYLRLAGVVRAACAALGFDTLDALRVASALGTASAVALAYTAAARTVDDRGRALRAALWIAASPGILFFATVAEVHGVFLPFAVLAWWIAAGGPPSAARALAAGTVTGLAAAVHATGHLLPLALLGFAWARAPRWGVVVGCGLALAAAHAVVFLGVARAVVPGGAGTAAGDQLAFAREGALRLWTVSDVWTPLRVTVREWLLPFGALAVLPLLAVRRGPALARRGALGLLAAAALYLVAAECVLTGADEHGAYLLPLAWPAAVLASCILRPRPAWLLVGLTCATSLVWLRLQDRPQHDPELAQVLAEQNQAAPLFLFFAGRREADTILRYRLPIPHSRVHDLGFLETAGTDFERVCQLFDLALRQLRAAGLRVVITSEALETMQSADAGAVGRMAREHLPQRYTLQPLREALLDAVEIVPR